MVYVRAVLIGGDTIGRKLNAVRTKLPNEIKSEVTEVIYKKLKNVYAYKRDTGAIFRSITRDRNKGIVFMGGTPETKNARGTDYTIFVEQLGSRAHSFFLPITGQSNKLVGGRRYRVRTHAPVRGRRKAIARAIRLFPQLSDRAIRKVIK